MQQTHAVFGGLAHYGSEPFNSVQYMDAIQLGKTLAIDLGLHGSWQILFAMFRLYSDNLLQATERMAHIQ